MKNQESRSQLDASGNRLDDMRQFSEFLTTVAKEIEKDMGNTGGDIDVNKVQMRFKNLKQENSKLKARKVAINKEIEENNA